MEGKKKKNPTIVTRLTFPSPSPSLFSSWTSLINHVQHSSSYFLLQLPSSSIVKLAYLMLLPSSSTGIHEERGAASGERRLQQQQVVQSESKS